jgi:hypothetical protein
MSRPEQAALFGDEIPEAAPLPRVNDRGEAAALAEVMQVLKHHPAVAWCERQNSGVARIGGRFVRFGWPGCSDVLGQLKDGRLLAVECKRPRGNCKPIRPRSSVWCADSVAWLSWPATTATCCASCLPTSPGHERRTLRHRK